MPYIDRITNTLERHEPGYILRQKFEEGLVKKVAEQKELERKSREAEVLDKKEARKKYDKLPGVVDDISKKNKKGGTWSKGFK